MKKRYPILDEIRGFAILCMIFFHAFFTFGFLFQWQWARVLFDFFMPAEPFFAFAFVFISGICAKLTRSNVRRGGLLLAVAVTLSVVTIVLEKVFFFSGIAIYFGILHLLAVAMLLYAAIGRWFDRLPMVASMVVLIALTVLTYSVKDGAIGIGTLRAQLPVTWYQSDWLAPFGFPSITFASADYFPLIPWLFAFFAGAAFGRYVADDKLPAFCSKSHVPALAYLGRHSLILYLAHQPIIYGLGELILLLQ